MNNRNDEQKVIDMVKQISVEPTKQFKNETFKLVQEEVKYARRQAEKKKSWFSISPAFITSFAMMAIIGLVTILWVSNDAQNPIGGPVGDGSNDVNQDLKQPDEPDERELEGEEELYGLSDREEMIVRKVEIEGMDNNDVEYQLLDRETMPFSTYFQGNMLDIVESEEEAYDVVELQAHIDPETAVKIFILNTEDRAEAENIFEEDILAEYQEIESLLDDESLLHVKVHDAIYEATYASLYFEHDYYYVIWQSAGPEFGDGWAAHYEVLIDEWQWK